MISDNLTIRTTILYSVIISSRLAGSMEYEGEFNLTELKGDSIIFCDAIRGKVYWLPVIEALNQISGIRFAK